MFGIIPKRRLNIFASLDLQMVSVNSSNAIPNATALTYGLETQGGITSFTGVAGNLTDSMLFEHWLIALIVFRRTW
jgi:hypothetical protein